MTSTSTNNSQHARLPTYVYIAGRGHSGSTLLTLLLARHPQVTAIGELSLLSLQIARDETTRWVGQCSCGERPVKCSMWGQVLREIEQEESVNISQNPFSWRISDVGMEEEFRKSAPVRVPLIWLRNRLWRVLRYAQYLSPAALGKLLSVYKPQAVWARNRSTLVSKLARVNDVSGVVDASKDPLDMLDVYRYSTVPVKIIFLTRDSRGNVWSILRRMKSMQTRASKIAAAANEWVIVNGRIWRLFQKIPSADRLHLKYEDLCRQPEVVMNELFKFVGLGPIDVVSGTQSNEDDTGQGHTIGGNKIRFSSEKLNIREDTAWSENLNVDELEAIRKVTVALSQELGYEQ